MQIANQKLKRISWILTAVCGFVPGGSAQLVRPSPRPAIAPFIAERYPDDTDGDRLDDFLAQQAQRALAAEQRAVTPEEKNEAQARQLEARDIELIFKE